MLFKELDKLPKPDLILASPPCESWSNASAMLDGNVCWYTEKIDTLFSTEYVKNSFTIRTRNQLETKNDTPFKKHWWKTVYSRLNGELCAFNTLLIINRYKPKFWVIENPQSSRIWKYFEEIQNLYGIKNIAHYSAYEPERFSKKPTCFYSNISLNLKTTTNKSELTFQRLGEKGISRSYNARSEIPLTLIQDIINQVKERIDV